MKPVPHGEPYAGKLHVRFDEGAGVPYGASRSTLHPFELRTYLFSGNTGLVSDIPMEAKLMSESWGDIVLE